MFSKLGRLVACEPNMGLKLVSIHGSDNELFQNVILIRQQGTTSSTYAFDQYSEHYCLLHQYKPVGVLTSTRSVCGAVDCAEFYPPYLLRQFRRQLVSNCKFRINSSSCSQRLAAMRWMVREVWKDLLTLGVRLDVINTKREMAPFYKKMGYTLIEGYDFIHPQLGTDSVVLFLAADPTIPSSFQVHFQGIPDVLPHNSVTESIANSVAPRV